MMKYHCYIDERGQDTKGKIFVISLIILTEDRELIYKTLSSIEKETKKYKSKWIKTDQKVKIEYLNKVFKSKLPIKILFDIYKTKIDYTSAIIISISKAVNKIKFTQYKGTFCIDALSKKGQQYIGNQLHKMNIMTEKVRGIKKDENDEVIRLADAIVGFIRKAEEGNKDLKKIFDKNINSKIIKV